MPKRLTTEEFILKAKKIHGDKYSYFTTNYINMDIKVEVYCNLCEEYFLTLPRSHVGNKKSGCLSCRKKNRVRNAKILSRFLEKSNLIYAGQFSYFDDYKDSVTPIKIKCKLHDVIFHQTPSHHLHSNGCPACKLDKRKLHSESKNHNEVISNINTKIIDICEGGLSKHNINGYIDCQSDTRDVVKKISSHESKYGMLRVTNSETFIKKLLKVSTNPVEILFDKVEYVSTHRKVILTCTKHGDFMVTPSGSLKKKIICPKCSKERFVSNVDDFITKAKRMHGERFSYDKVDYERSNMKVIITCIKHGDFLIRPNDLLTGYGCPNCGNNISKGESEIADWIKINTDYDVERNVRQYLSGKFKYELDIYIPELNLAIEYNGLRWHHTVGSTYDGKLSIGSKPKNYHKNKSQYYLDEQGIRIIHIWEHEWLLKKDIVKNILAMELGIIQKVIYAKNCIIREINNEYNSIFLDGNHIQGGKKSTYNLGLFTIDNELVSSMSFTISKQEKSNWELTRFTNKIGHIVIGGADKLFKHFVGQHMPNEIISFNPIRLFSGEFCINLGFELKKILPPTYFYHYNLKIINRQLARKKNLAKLFPTYEVSENESIVETMNNNLYFQVFDSGVECWLYK